MEKGIVGVIAFGAIGLGSEPGGFVVVGSLITV